VFPDGSYLGVSKTLETTVARIAAVSQKDAEAWKAMLARFGTDAPHIFALLGSAMPSRAAMGAIWKAARERGVGWLYETLKLLVASPRDFLDAHFESDKLKATMAAWGLHLDFAPDIAGGALFPYLESMANQAFGMVIGQGGADTIVRAMIKSIEERRGEVRLGARVTSIDVSAGVATGVTLASGETLEARHVIANVHPKLVFGELVGEQARTQRYRAALAKFRAGPGTMIIHLALDDLPDWRAGETLRRFAYVHIGPDLEMMGRAYAQAAAGLLPEAPLLIVGQPTAIDPSRAPAGKHVLWVQVRVVPSIIRGDAAGKIAAQSWDEAKEIFAERVLDLIEAHAPSLRRSVLGRAVVSPLDLERENPNLIGGDSLSGSHHLDQNFFLRPVPGWSRYATPIRNLHLCGASTWPGGGTGAASGFLLAKALAG
jgi:phytoene dehydrogenase-like protein